MTFAYEAYFIKLFKESKALTKFRQKRKAGGENLLKRSVAGDCKVKGRKRRKSKKRGSHRLSFVIF